MRFTAGIAEAWQSHAAAGSCRSRKRDRVCVSVCAYWSWLLCSIFLEPTTAHRSSSYRSSGSFGGFTPHFMQAAVTTCGSGTLASEACKGISCGHPQEHQRKNQLSGTHVDDFSDHCMPLCTWMQAARIIYHTSENLESMSVAG